jgi:hypothetical protein
MVRAYNVHPQPMLCVSSFSNGFFKRDVALGLVQPSYIRMPIRAKRAHFNLTEIHDDLRCSALLSPSHGTRLVNITSNGRTFCVACTDVVLSPRMDYSTAVPESDARMVRHGPITRLMPWLRDLDGASLSLQGLMVSHGHALFRATGADGIQWELLVVASYYVDIVPELHQVRLDKADEADVDFLRRDLEAAAQCNGAASFAQHSHGTPDHILKIETNQGRFFIWGAQFHLLAI